MTSPWRIFFSGLLACALPAASVTGRVELVNPKQPAAARRGDFSGAVVWLVPTVPPPARAARPATATIIQKDKTFTPHILAVELGTRVAFPNFDPIFHNAFSNYDGRVFDLGLYAPGSTRAVTFDRAGVVRVFCNIHSSMSAVIVVTPAPWFSLTPASGAFELKDVPPGEYTLRLFHERATPETLARLERRITVASGPLDLGTLALPESGFLNVPHKNKYGADYGPENDNNHLYPAPRK